MPNIVFKDRNGNGIVYKGITSISVLDENGNIVTYYYGGSPTPSEGTTATIENNQLVLNGASINEDNNLSLENALIDENGYLVIEKGSE